MGADIGGIIAGLINSGQSLPTMDVSQLLNTISANQGNNATLINNLPAAMQPLYAQYMQGMNGAGTTLNGTTNTIGNNLLNSTTGLYGPNSAAVNATLAGLKQQDYSTLPGSINALKSNLAASGGLSRGGASRAITSATLAPAQTFSGQAATVEGQQLQAQQAATQQALNKIASLDDNTAQQLFGMSKQQATEILTSGRQDLQQQLTQLVNNNNNATNQTLGVEGVAANNGYQNAVTQNGQQAGIVNGLVNLGVDGGMSMLSGAPAMGGAIGYDPSTMSTPTGANANPTAYGITQ